MTKFADEVRRLLATGTPGPFVVDYGHTVGHVKSVAESLKPNTPTILRYDQKLIGLISVNEGNAKSNALLAAKLLSNAERIAALVDAAKGVIDLDFRGPSSDKLRKAFSALEGDDQ